MGLNPPAPDLTLPEVQTKSDGELFWIVGNGIRMTGMPAFSLTHKPDEVWKIVAFIRHLPEISADEQKVLKAECEEQEQHHEEEQASSAGTENARPQKTPMPHSRDRSAQRLSLEPEPEWVECGKIDEMPMRFPKAVAVIAALHFSAAFERVRDRSAPAPLPVPCRGHPGEDRPRDLLA